MINSIKKIQKFITRNYKSLLFAFIFICICFLYNINDQTLNNILKRGVVLEYSIINSKNTAGFEKIEKILKEQKIRKFIIEEADRTPYEELDSDGVPIKKVLFVQIPLLLKNDKINIANQISDCIFENYENSKLINISTLGNSYNDSFSAFFKFLGILFIAGVLWLILLYLFFDKTISFKAFKNGFYNFLNNRKADFSHLINKTKENGPGYFIKRILFDGDEEENETNYTKEIISTIVFVLLCVIAIRYFIGELRWIPSGSMRPTIMEKDRVFVEKLKYPKKEIQRGDIIVFYPPEVQLSNSPFAIFARLSGIFCRDIAFIKRVVGMPNDKLEIKRSNATLEGEYRVYINDEPLNEPYISSKTKWSECSENMYCGPFVIPENHYFMMGDNRNNSQDSRFWGFLDGNRIIGRANFMFFPISRINMLRDNYVKLHKSKQEKNTQEAVYIIDRY